MGSLIDSLISGKAYILMIFLQFGFAGMYTISVFSLKRGMNHFVLVVYRNLSATIFIAPFAFYFERKIRPKMTVKIFLKVLALALLEPVMDQNLYYVGAKLTSASFSTALFNILPALTFVIAIILRMEKIKIKSLYTQAKIAGTVVTVAGALVMILYEGPDLPFPWDKPTQADFEANDNDGDFIKGTILLFCACLSWACFFVLQSNTLASYPAELSLTTAICFMGTVESTIVTLVMEKGAAQPWIIGWDLRLVTAVYSGIMCSGIAYYVQGIVMKERGPVFVTAFNPLCMIIVAVLGSLFLNEMISLGKLIGAIIIVIGLYSLIWGKSKDYALEKLNQANEKSSAGTFELPMSAQDHKH